MTLPDEQYRAVLIAVYRNREKDMTLPDERYRAVLAAERLLLDLCNPKLTPRVPRAVRDQARSVLRHFPSRYDMSKAAQTSPDVFQPQMEDLHRFIVSAGVDLDQES